LAGELLFNYFTRTNSRKTGVDLGTQEEDRVTTLNKSLKLQTMSQGLQSEPVPTTIELITPIWQRVLQRSSILPDDNFFDLGGTPGLASRLFPQIGEVCGRDLTPLMIYRAPTIRMLATLLDEPGVPRFPPLMLLKPGRQGPPLFLAHGLGSSVMEFFPLVSKLEIDRPIYGLQARGTDGVEEPSNRVEDAALFFLDAIKHLQPRGPYLLVGYSLGGLITLEIARRLSENGETVALLVLMEAFPHARYLPLGQFMGVARRKLQRHLSVVLGLALPDALSYLKRRTKNVFPRSRSRKAGRLISDPACDPDPRSQEDRRLRDHPRFVRHLIRDTDWLALARYRPHFYSGNIKFVRAEEILHLPDDPAAVWANMAGKFEVETVPGDHFGILTTHCEELAAVLSRYVREALSKE
jgi:acetoacetyl-CoA synthetase